MRHAFIVVIAKIATVLAVLLGHSCSQAVGSDVADARTARDDPNRSGVDSGVKAITVAGRVTDDRGRGVPGIPVANCWTLEEPGLAWDPVATDFSIEEGSPPYWQAVMSDDYGGFSFMLGLPDDRPIAIMAIDAEQGRGAVVQVNPGRRSGPLTLRLKPLADVRAAFVSGVDGDPVPIWWALYLDKNGMRVANGHEESGRIQIPLPRARYHLSVESEGYRGAAFRFETKKRTISPGTVRLEPTVLSQLKGELAPEIHVTSAMGLPAGVLLADLRGKWVLVDFWGNWCGPCVRGIPELLRFWDDHGALHDSFEILVFHEQSVTSLEELTSKLAPIADEFWDGRALPFPILIDDTGTTLKRYGITGFPTMVLIDPQGHIVDSKVGTDPDGSRLLERFAEELRAE